MALCSARCGRCLVFVVQPARGAVPQAGLVQPEGQQAGAAHRSEELLGVGCQTHRGRRGGGGQQQRRQRRCQLALRRAERLPRPPLLTRSAIVVRGKRRRRVCGVRQEVGCVGQRVGQLMGSGGRLCSRQRRLLLLRSSSCRALLGRRLQGGGGREGGGR